MDWSQTRIVIAGTGGSPALEGAREALAPCRDRGARLEHVAGLAEALALLARLPAAPLPVVVFSLADFAGEELGPLRALRDRHPGALLVALVDAGSRRRAVAALRLGADVLLPEPFYPAELRLLVERAAERAERAERVVQPGAGEQWAVPQGPPAGAWAVTAARPDPADPAEPILVEAGLEAPPPAGEPPVAAPAPPPSPSPPPSPPSPPPPSPPPLSAAPSAPPVVGEPAPGVPAPAVAAPASSPAPPGAPSAPESAHPSAPVTAPPVGGVPDASPPLRAGDLAAPGRPSAPAAESPPESPPESPAGRLRRVLLVDRERLFRELLADVLRRKGFYVADACDEKQALWCLAEADYDAILLDGAAAGANGALGAFREAAPDTPVVVMTSLADGGEDARLRRAGAAASISKPFDLEQLLAVLEKVLRASRRRAFQPTHPLLTPEEIAALLEPADGQEPPPPH